MTLFKSRRVRLLVLFCSLSLAAAACIRVDDPDEVAATQDTDAVAARETADDDEAVDETVDEEPSNSAGTPHQQDIEEASEQEHMTAEEEAEIAEPEVPTIEALFEEAADRRARVVERIRDRIESGQWGIGDDNILRGPEGFEIDLNECPADWSDTEGITDTEIRIGQIGPQTGRLASYDSARLGWMTYLDYVNAQGGVRGLRVVMQSRDDANEATKTIEHVNDLLQNDNVFAIHTLGSPNTLAVYDSLNDQCIPQPFVWTGHPAWGDPQVHPWTTGSILSHATEAVLWGRWIKENLADELPVVVAGLAADYGFGPVYESGFRQYAESNPDVVSEFVSARHAPAASTLTEEIATLASSGPDVFISMTAGNACLLAIEEVAESGLKEELAAAFTPSVCATPSSWIAPAGDAGHGWLVVGGGVKDIADAALAEHDVFVQFVIQSLEANGLDPAISMFGNGYMLGYPYVEALRIAAELPGGLTRTNFILAVRAIDIRHPMFPEAVAFAMNGNADAFPVEGSGVSRYDALSHAWVASSVVDVNGGTPDCVWDADSGGCR